MSNSNIDSTSNVLVISSDCHAGALPATYEELMPQKYRKASAEWWLSYSREMVSRAGTFFDQEAVEAFSSDAGQGGGRLSLLSQNLAYPPITVAADEVTLVGRVVWKSGRV